MIIEAIREYYKKLDLLWLSKRNTHPKVPYVDKINPFNMYLGQKNDTDYIEWKVQRATNEIDFNIIESIIGFKLRDELKQYLSEYWFLKMSGTMNGVKITLTPLTPLVDITVFITERVRIAKKQHRDACKIEIGLAEIEHADGYLLLFDNNSGQIEAFDPDKNTTVILANDLVSLILNMEPRC